MTEKSQISRLDALLYCVMISGPSIINGMTQEMFGNDRQLYMWISWLFTSFVTICAGLKAYRSGKAPADGKDVAPVAPPPVPPNKAQTIPAP